MSSNPPRWRARYPLSILLLLLSLFSVQPACAQSNTTATSMEVDLISPVANGVYRINPDRGLAVIVAIQNRQHGDPADWRFEWTAMRLTPDRPRFFVGGAVSASGTNIRGSVTHPLNQSASDPYLALSHPYIEPGTDKPTTHPTPPGEYEFTWNVQIGPWCEVLAVPRSREYSSNHFVSRGRFNFTVAEDAPWPVLTKTTAGEGDSCASVAGQVRRAVWAVCDDGERDGCAGAVPGDGECGAGGEGFQYHDVGRRADGDAEFGG
ncbi:hypothetical protein B0T18DRAFT_394346 [Schizothecium vesticola]|uniref:DUF7136 domain-containing protein n=1 Tax=Schizothecium vesticola TaxID=314040 RepID=A0AA40BPP5_9PEZI|nr:hypothetical protein B0T18DRAFT_394346 [Schizothecium vesticola]